MSKSESFTKKPNSSKDHSDTAAAKTLPENATPTQSNPENTRKTGFPWSPVPSTPFYKIFMQSWPSKHYLRRV